MARPDVAAVRAGFQTSLDDPAVDSYVDDAEILLRKAYAENELDDSEERTMWKYLTRHLIRFASEDRQMNQKSLGSGQVTYSGDFSEMLRATSPGQTVIMLDEQDRFRDLTQEGEDLFLDVH